MRDNLAQPNQKKGWKGLAPGASFATGGPIDDEDITSAIPDEVPDDQSAFAVADRPRPPISGPQDEPPGDPPIPRRRRHSTGVDFGAPQEPNQDQLASNRDLSMRNLERTGAAPGEEPAQNIAAYIMGGPAGGGTDEETAEKFSRPHKHKGLSDEDANLMGVQKAFEMGGVDAAWQLVQFHRGAYNAKGSIAKAAASGVEGKAPDMQTAAHAATVASAHMLDGSSVHFAPTNGGVTATVKIPGTAQEQQLVLNAQQFIQAVDPMGDGQYDKVIEQGGMPSHLARAAKSNFGTTPSSAGGDLSGGQGPQNYPVNPAQYDENGKETLPAYQTKGPGYNSAREEQSRRIFPKGSEDRQRNAWMAGQEGHEADRQNKVEVAKETAKGKVEAQDVRGVHGENIAQIGAEARKYGADARGRSEAVKAAARLQELMRRSKDRREHEAMSTLRTKLLDPMHPPSKAEEAQIDEFLQASRVNAPAPPIPQGPTPQAAAPQAHAPQGAPPRPSNVPPEAQFFKGHWYVQDGAKGRQVD